MAGSEPVAGSSMGAEAAGASGPGSGVSAPERGVTGSACAPKEDGAAASGAGVTGAATASMACEAEGASPTRKLVLRPASRALSSAATTRIGGRCVLSLTSRRCTSATTSGGVPGAKLVSGGGSLNECCAM